jgi:hypothetical protein
MSGESTAVPSERSDTRFLPRARRAGDPGGQVRALLEAPERPVYLARADLSGADLHGLNLAGVVLCGADLRGANLSGVTVEGDLTEWPSVDLSGADLTGANLSGATLRGVSFRAATIRGIDWTGVQVTMVGEGTPDEVCDFLWSKHDFPTVAETFERSGDKTADRVIFALSDHSVLSPVGETCKASERDDRRTYFLPSWRGI